MSNGSSWKNTLKRTRDSLKRKFHCSRDFLSTLRSVGDERRGFHLSRERPRPESTETFEEMSNSGEVESEFPSEMEMTGGHNSGESPAGSHHHVREPVENSGMPAEDSTSPQVQRTRCEESRVSVPLAKGASTTDVNESSSRETLTEGSHRGEIPASERSPDAKSCVNRFLSNDPLAGESSTRQSLRGRPLARESEVDGSLPRDRSSTTRPDMDSSSERGSFAPNTPEETEGIENVEQIGNMDDVEQFGRDEDVEWFEHVEYADQDLYTSLPAEESLNNTSNSRTTSTSTSPDPTTRRPRHQLATAENNRLLRLPLEIRMMIYDELLAIPRTISLLHPKKERHPFHSIRKVDKELFTRRARQRFKYSRPSIGYYDPRTTTFAARFTDDENCTHRQWGSEHLGAITNFAPRPALLHQPQPPYRQQQQQQQSQPRASSAAGSAAGGGPTPPQPPPPPPPTNNRSRGTALLYGICSPACKRANFLTWQAIHAHLVHANTTLTTPDTPPTTQYSSSSFTSSSTSTSTSTSILVLELEFPRICSAINVLKSLVLGRIQGWRELRRLSVLRIRIRNRNWNWNTSVTVTEAEAGAGVDGTDGSGGVGEELVGGPLNEVDMVALYSLAVTLGEEMERKVLLRRGPWIEIAW